MNLEEFQKTYQCGQKFKIKITCDICNKENIINREKAEENIIKHGKYIDRSCSMKQNHKCFPRNEKTRNKQRLGRLGKKHSNESKERMVKSANEKWESDWGKSQKKKLSKLTALKHSVASFDKSKRKVMFKSKKNNDIRVCNSSWEFIFCEMLENDDQVISYETQVYYQVDGRERSLDFLIHYLDGINKAIEIKPKKRLTEEYHINQIKDSEKNAHSHGYVFAILTEFELGIKNSKEATAHADAYRKEHYDLDYATYRKQLDVEKSMRFYYTKIATDKVTLFCDFCQTNHEALRLTHDKNIARNGKYICEREGGKIAGSRPKLHLQKVNPYLNEGKKQCNQCKEVLLLELFGDDKAKRDGKSTRCKECRSKASLNKYYDNKTQ